MEDIKKLIESLPGPKRLELEGWLERAKLSEENQTYRERIRTLENLYRDLKEGGCTDRERLSTVLECVELYKARIRGNDYSLSPSPFCDSRPLTIGDLKGILAPGNDGLGVKVGIDDGMGYCPQGLQGAFEAYLDESGDLVIWI